jgi:RNA polymerase sigma-70 factor (ECF subfamily)
LDDNDLLVLAARRPEVFGAFYERHAEEILRYFAKRTFDPDAAAELTSETFAAAFVSRARFRPQGVEAVRWLYRIASHQLSRYFRRAAVDSRARRRLGMPDRELSEEDYERIEELMDLQTIRHTMGTAFGRLSNDQREAVTLRVVEGRPYPEVAGMLGLTEPAARARVSRGLRRLQSLIELHHTDVQTGGEPT